MQNASCDTHSLLSIRWFPRLNGPVAEVNKLNMARMQCTHACRLEGQEMMRVGIALVNLLITKTYGPVIRRVLPKESVHCTEL